MNYNQAVDGTNGDANQLFRRKSWNDGVVGRRLANGKIEFLLWPQAMAIPFPNKDMLGGTDWVLVKTDADLKKVRED